MDSIAKIDKEIEKLAKDMEAISLIRRTVSNVEYKSGRLSMLAKQITIMDRLDELRIILVDLGDNGGRCSWCLKRIKGKHYKVTMVSDSGLSRVEKIYDSCKQCFDEFGARNGEAIG